MVSDMFLLRSANRRIPRAGPGSVKTGGSIAAARVSATLSQIAFATDSRLDMSIGSRSVMFCAKPQSAHRGTAARGKSDWGMNAAVFRMMI